MSDEPTLRADARRNREQILAAAKVVFTSTGPDTPVEEIARAAGVSVGTLYRRFPDREALITAVGRDNLHSAVVDARSALADEPTAWDALVRILHQSQELRLSVQLAMASPTARAVLRDDAVTNELRREMVDLLDRVVEAAQREGALRSDIGSGDVAMMFVLLLKQVSLPRAEALRRASQRSLAIMLDGLRARPGQQLPGAPLSRADLGF